MEKTWRWLVVKKQLAVEPPFYTSEEIVKLASGNFYLRLNEAEGNWREPAETAIQVLEEAKEPLCSYGI